MPRRRRKVSFEARVPTRTRVGFETREGPVSFTARKKRKKRVSFYAEG
jgi:hypothetical protein